MLVESHQLKHNNKVKLVGALIADFEQVDTNPAGNYMSKLSIEALEEGVKYVQSQQ